jgi:hypothetical protein
MKKNFSFLSRKTALIFTALLLMGSLAATAQITLPGGSDNVEDVPDSPIDGFLTIGLIAGAAIGLRKKIKGLKN